MSKSNVVSMRNSRANRTPYARAADLFNIDDIISGLEDNAVAYEGQNDSIDTYVNARPRRAA